MEFKLNELAELCHTSAQEKGWYDEPNARTPAEALLLIHSEVSEIVEELRTEQPNGKIYFKGSIAEEHRNLGTAQELAACGYKPDGEAMEVADVLIRLLDYAHWRGINVEAAVEIKMIFNSTRPKRHGKKF